MQFSFFRGSRCQWTAAIVVAALTAIGVGPAWAQTNSRLLSRDKAARLGLDRAWFTQAELDRGRSRVERSILSGDNLFVLTSAGLLQSIHALTGETQWSASLGNPDYPSLGPAANEQFVALINGSTLHVLDRTDGRLVISRPVGGAPGAAPAMSRNYCFVPLITGRLVGFPVRPEVVKPWFYQSAGRAIVSPVVTSSSVIWSTTSGHVYVGHATEPGVRFRLETGSEIVASPAFRRPNMYAGTVAGELFAVHEGSGARRWKTAIGYPILRTPAAVGDRVYVTSVKPALYAVDAASGTVLWEAPGIAQFAAASRQRVYAMDQVGSLVVLDATSGSVLDKMPTDGTSTALVNDQTDRLYLIKNDGLVQCLHELGADKPLYHNPPEEPLPNEGETAPIRPTAPAKGTAPTVTPAVPAASGNPFGGAGGESGTPSGGAAPPSGGAGSPFGGGSPTGGPPTGETPVGGNPFDR